MQSTAFRIQKEGEYYDSFIAENQTYWRRIRYMHDNAVHMCMYYSILREYLEAKCKVEGTSVPNWSYNYKCSYVSIILQLNVSFYVCLYNLCEYTHTSERGRRGGRYLSVYTHTNTSKDLIIFPLSLSFLSTPLPSVQASHYHTPI